MATNPNFPVNLDIKPLHNLNDSHVLESFDLPAQEAAIREYGIAGRVWEAAYFMNAYIAGAPNTVFDPPFLTPHGEARPLMVLELGSGTGIVSAQCAERLAGALCTIVATDLPEVCPLLEKNLSKYGTSAPEGLSRHGLLVRPLAWGNYEHAQTIFKELWDRQFFADSGPALLTHVICSDLVYFPELLAPLLRSLLHLTSPPFVASEPSDWPKVIISYKIRSLPKEMSFWSAFGLWFAFEPVLCCEARRTKPGAAIGNADARAGEVEQDPAAEASWTRFGSAGDDEIFIFVARRNPGSLNWDVPAGDAELLSGVGAGGTPSRKSDGTFETLLLMNMAAE